MSIFKKKEDTRSAAEQDRPLSPEEELRAEAAAEAEAQAVLEKFDRESNVRIWEGVPRSIVRYLMVAFAVYSVLINLVFNWETRIERAF